MCGEVNRFNNYSERKIIPYTGRTTLNTYTGKGLTINDDSQVNQEMYGK